MIFIKIIELGENFNTSNYEKSVICPICGSKLEPDNEDVKFGSYLEPYFSNFMHEWSSVKRHGANIVCPVCNNDVGLKRKEEIKK